MAKFTKYRFQLSELHREYCRELGLSKKNRKRISMGEPLKQLAELAPEHMVGLAGREITHEWNWINSKKTMLFIPDKKTFEDIYRGRYSVKSIEAIKPFTDDFIVNFPSDLRVDGHQLHSLLVGYCRGDEFIEKRVKPMREQIGASKVQLSMDGDPLNELNLEFFYRARDESGRFCTYRMLATPELMAAVITGGDIDPNAEERPRLLDEVQTNATDNALQAINLRFLVSLTIYINACQANNKECLVNGLPGGLMSGVSRDKALKEFKPSVMSIAPSRNATSADTTKDSHYRSWHIRQLTAERYYKNEYEGLERGSRLVFVSDSIVNSNPDAKTLSND